MSVNRLPSVLKIGHAHAGLGKMKVETAADFQDAASVVAVARTYCTVEPFVDAKFDVHIQKIGNYFKAFMQVTFFPIFSPFFVIFYRFFNCFLFIFYSFFLHFLFIYLFIYLLFIFFLQFF